MSSIKIERDRPRFVFPTLSAGPPALGLRGFELRSGLLAVTNGVVSAEWNLLSAGQQELLAAFHQVLLIKGPRIHKVLEHAHDHVLRNVADGQALGNPARLAGERELIGGFL